MSPQENDPQYHYRFDFARRTKFSPKGARDITTIMRVIDEDWKIAPELHEGLERISSEVGNTIGSLLSGGGVISRSGLVLEVGMEKLPTALIEEAQQCGLTTLLREEAGELGYQVPEAEQESLKSRSYIIVVPSHFDERLGWTRIRSREEVVDAASPVFPLSEYPRHSGRGSIYQLEKAGTKYTQTLFDAYNVDDSFLRPRSMMVGHLFNIAETRGKGYVPYSELK